jgi:APA family basic amino acid/polyamine antiporter
MKSPNDNKLVRGLGAFDATMIVIGSMIGSGIFIVSAKSAVLVGAPGWLLAVWAIAGVLTITGALCCAELAAMMPRAGGQYVFLREAYGLRPVFSLAGRCFSSFRQARLQRWRWPLRGSWAF